MLQYEKIDVSEGIDINKTFLSKEFEKHVCKGCHNLLTMASSLKNIAILSAKGATFRCLLMSTSKNEALKKINNSETYDKGIL